MLVDAEFLDGALGFTSGPPRGHVKLGVSASGTNNKLISLTDGQQAITEFTSGALPEATAFSLAQGGTPVYAMKLNASVAATISAVVAVLKAGSDGALALTGSVPLDTFDCSVVMTREGRVGVSPAAAFKIALDGKDTYSDETAVPAGGIYDVPGTGIRLNFTNGAVGFKVGDEFTFTSVGPGYSTTDLNAALVEVRKDTKNWEFVHVIGPATAAVAAVVQTWLNTMAADGRYPWVLLEARDINTAGAETEDAWMTALTADFSSFTAPRGEVSVSVGFCELISAISGRLYRRPLAWTVAARAASVPFQRDLGRVKDGPLAGIARNVNGVSIYHDERTKPGLETARFLTVQSLLKKQGFFVGGPAKRSPATMASVTSDYRFLPNVRVIRYAAGLALEFGTDMLGDEIETNADGTILERAAVEFDNNLTSKLRDNLVATGYCVAVRTQVNRAINLLTTQHLIVKLLVRPFAYAKWVSFQIGFENPNLKTPKVV